MSDLLISFSVMTGYLHLKPVHVGKKETAIKLTKAPKIFFNATVSFILQLQCIFTNGYVLFWLYTS